MKKLPIHASFVTKKFTKKRERKIVPLKNYFFKKTLKPTHQVQHGAIY